ncbi:MAG: alpha/beta fold hydrolase [Solirubrobacteraceae bacterium]
MNPTTATDPSTFSQSDDPSVYGPQGRSPWLDIDWREHQRWVILDRQPVNVIELGEGPPLVFLHGLIGRWTHWVEQLTAFAPSHRVIALDLPGFGDSPLPAEGGISVPIYARTLERLMEELEIDSAAFVGHSMGGFTAIELAINFPERVERLALVSPAGLSTYKNPRDVMMLSRARQFSRPVAAGQALVAANGRLLARRPRLRRFEPATNLVTRYPERIPAPYVFEFTQGLAPPGFVEGVAANQDYDYRERLKEVACPTLIVWGERDKVITYKDAAEYERLIPNARKVIFADTGHMAMIERPAAFNALLEGFLDG